LDDQLAVSSGVALRRVDGRLYFVELKSAWIPTTTFVLGLLAFILTVNGGVQLILTLGGGGGLLVLGLILTTIGPLLGFATVKLFKLGVTRRELPTDQLRTLAILDLSQGALLDGEGRYLAPLSEVSFPTRFQWTSSSRRLVARWPGGELNLVDGNPFAGGLVNIQYELARQGFEVK
jgi:hypothetical protein